jgi:ABC-type transporter Mla MlaB component
LEEPVIDFRVVIVSIWPESGHLGPLSAVEVDRPASGVHGPDFEGLRIDPLNGLKVSGEIDHTTRKIWQEALGGLVASGGDMHLDLAELTFIDVRGAWLLAKAARDLPSESKVYLHRSPYCLRSVLTLIGSDPSPIEVETR